MATNEHFLLVHLANLSNATDIAIYPVDEVIRSVKNARTLAGLSVGSRTDSLVKKSLRKLAYNGHVKFVECGGQRGFRITPRGFSEFKRAVQECPAGKLCPPRAAVPARAREVLRTGSFLKKRLIRDTDDILEYVGKKIRTTVEKDDFSIITNDQAISYLIALEGHFTSPSPVSSPPTRSVANADHLQARYTRLVSDEPPSEYFKPGMKFEDLVSESEAERLPQSASESEFDSCSLPAFCKRGSSTSFMLRQPPSPTHRGSCHVPAMSPEGSPRLSSPALLFRGDEIEESKQAGLLDVSSDLHQFGLHGSLKMQKVHRKDSFDSDQTLVESSSTYGSPSPTLADIKPDNSFKSPHSMQLFSCSPSPERTFINTSASCTRSCKPLGVRAERRDASDEEYSLTYTRDRYHPCGGLDVRTEKRSRHKPRALVSYWE